MYEEKVLRATFAQESFQFAEMADDEGSELWRRDPRLRDYGYYRPAPKEA